MVPYKHLDTFPLDIFVLPKLVVFMFYTDRRCTPDWTVFGNALIGHDTDRHGYKEVPLHTVLSDICE